jgi:hypothetical protein
MIDACSAQHGWLMTCWSAAHVAAWYGHTSTLESWPVTQLNMWRVMLGFLRFWTLKDNWYMAQKTRADIKNRLRKFGFPSIWIHKISLNMGVEEWKGSSRIPRDRWRIPADPCGHRCVQFDVSKYIWTAHSWQAMIWKENVHVLWSIILLKRCVL